MSSAQRYSCLPGHRHESIYDVATRLVTALLQVLPAKIMQGSRGSSLVQHTPLSGRDEQSASLWGLPCPACRHSLGVTPPCGLSSASFARGVSFPEMLPRFFSLWVRP